MKNQEGFYTQSSGSANDLMQDFLEKHKNTDYTGAPNKQKILTTLVNDYRIFIESIISMTSNDYEDDKIFKNNVGNEKKKVPNQTAKINKTTRSNQVEHKMDRLVNARISFNFRKSIIKHINITKQIARSFKQKGIRNDNSQDNIYFRNANYFLKTMEDIMFIFKRYNHGKLPRSEFEIMQNFLLNIKLVIDEIIDLYIRPQNDYSPDNLERFNEILLTFSTIINQYEERKLSGK